MPGARPKAVVVAWDLAHNGASCAFTLADLLRRRYEVEIVGPTFLGDEIWAPIRDTDIPIRAFPGRDLPAFVEDAERFVAGLRPDLVYAVKPRFPTLLLSMLIKDQCGAPAILHVDDLELGLVGLRDPISLDELQARTGQPEFSHPGRAGWVAVCDGLIGDADAITVSGSELMRRYGGVVLGQPRDETVFDPAHYDRPDVRAEFGYTDEDRVVLFLGSPRRHKGILELARAVAETHDPRVRLCVIGSFSDARLRAEVAQLDASRIQLVAYRPIAEVPRLLRIADLVCLPQDPSAPFVAYQTPMKLTEALAMGVPVLARETASLTPYARRGLIQTIGDAPLHERIEAMLAAPESLAAMAARGRKFFLEHLSYAAALRKLGGLIAGLPSGATEVPAAWERACELALAQPAGTSSSSTSARPTRSGSSRVGAGSPGS